MENILKRAEEIEDERKSTTSSTDSKISEDHHFVEKRTVHYEAYSPEITSDHNVHSDDSFDKVEKEDVEGKGQEAEQLSGGIDQHEELTKNYDAYSSENVVEQEHAEVVSENVAENFHNVERVVQYDPYSREVFVDERQHREHLSEDGEIARQDSDGYELPRSKDLDQHYSTVERTPTIPARYDNPPPTENQYVHNILVGQSFRSTKKPEVENDGYLVLKPHETVQHPITEEHQKTVEQVVDAPVKKEKNPYMAFDMTSDAAKPLIDKDYNLDDRDTHENVQYLNTGFFEVFAEPSPQYHSIACVWTLSFKIFEIVRVYSYKILTLIFGLLIAIIAGFLFAVFAFINIWIVRPTLYLARLALSQIITIWPMCLIYIVRPFFYSVGAIFSTARLHTSNGAQVPEIWEKHVHVV